MAGMRSQPQAGQRLNQAHPLARGLVGFWLPMGAGFVSALPGVPPAVLTPNAQFTGDPKGRRLGSNGNLAAYIQSSVRTKPTAAISVLMAGALSAGGSLGYTSYLIGCEDYNNGWGIYQVGGPSAQPRPYLRIGDAWADQPANISMSESGQVGFTFDGTTFWSVANGTRSNSQSVSGSITNSPADIGINSKNAAGQNSGNGAFHYLAMWNRALSPAELASFNANPWQMFDESEDSEQPALTAPKQYTLTAAAGSFATTGVGAGLRVGRRMVATVASFALAGAGARLISSRRLEAGSAALSLSGADVSLRAVRQLQASPGAFALTGSSVGMTYVPVSGPSGPTYTLTAASGVMGFTGAPAALRVQRRLQAASGGLLLNGSPARVLTARRISAQIGAFSLSGRAAALVYSASESVIDVSKISPYRVAVFTGSGSRISIFDGSGSRVAVFAGSGSRVSRFE